ncbi:Glycosyltransferase involved in cell wall bisynthesis [Parelusimicrobium proximum]|uniref:glycosyltransferase family 2 protein n=1 Tax=Parelusimicrobium proximum TaxID=3228953 RepID=UPI003D167FA5
MKISLIMIVKNEADNIGACLESVKDVCDEIIVIDDMSADDTAKIAESYGAKIHQKKFESFTEQKGYALSMATGEWVLNLDADEQLSPALKEEIKEAVKSDKYTGYYLPLTNNFLGREMKYSGLNGETHYRLCVRKGARYEGGRVHEALVQDGEAGRLKAHIIHTPYKTIEQYFKKFNFYTSLGAQTMAERGKKFNPINLFRPPFDFLKIYVLKLGFLDGLQGFLWAYYSAQYPFVKYTKLWHLNKLAAARGEKQK